MILFVKGERVPPKNGDTFKSKLVTLCWKENGRISSSTEAVQLPVPYQLPPQPYTHEGEWFVLNAYLIETSLFTILLR